VNAKCQTTAQGAESAVEHKFISPLLRLPDDDDGSCPSQSPLLANSAVFWAAIRSLKTEVPVELFRTKRHILAHEIQSIQYFAGDCS